MKVRLSQPFDAEYNFLCVRCKQVFEDFDLYIEIRQHDAVDADSRLAVHISCMLAMEALS
jgi:hypothetical protein